MCIFAELDIVKGLMFDFASAYTHLIPTSLQNTHIFPQDYETMIVLKLIRATEQSIRSHFPACVRQEHLSAPLNHPRSGW